MESKSDIAATITTTTITTKVADAVVAEPSPNEGCVLPKSQDALFGKSGIFRHPGNRSMLDLVDGNLIRYYESPRERKRFVVEEILNKLSQKRVRFLRRYENEDTDSVWWIEVPKEDAYEKVRSAFNTRKKSSQKKDAPGNQESDTIVLTTHYPMQQHQQYQEMRGGVSLHQGTQTGISESALQQKWNNNHRSTSIIDSPPHQRRDVVSTTTILPAASLTEGQNQLQSRLAITAQSGGNTSKNMLVKRSPNEYHPKTPDVLFGRATPYRMHPGNQRMMCLVKTYTSEFNKHHLGNEKKRSIVENIIDLITQGGGRFLRRNVDNGNGNSIAYWAEVSEQDAYDKVRKTFKTSKNDQAEYKRSRQIASSAATNTENVVTISPTDLDVISQQGTTFWDHQGNRLLLSLVEKNRNEYFKLPNGDSRKRSIVEGIVDELTRNGGRFLRRHQYYGELSWTEISEHAAIDKVRSAFSHIRPSLDQEVSKNVVSSKSWPNHRNQQLGTYSSNEETVVNHVTTESEYEKLEVVMDMHRRVDLFDENFGQPTYILYPEDIFMCLLLATTKYQLAEMYFKIIERPVHLDVVCKRIKDRQYRDLLDVYTDMCTMFDNFIYFHSYSGNKLTDPTPISIASHLSAFFKDLWQEHMLQSEAPALLSIDRSQIAMEQRAINREKRSASAGYIFVDTDCLKHAAQTMSDLIKNGGLVDVMDDRPIWGEGASFSNDNDKAIANLVLKNLRKLETDLHGMMPQKKTMSVREFEASVRKIYTQGHDLEISNTAAVHHRIASRIDRYIGQLTVPLYEGYCRGSCVSSIWGCVGAVIWARISSTNAFWPALVLGIIAIEEQRESWHTALTERNEARLPAKIKTGLTKAKRKAEQETDQQSTEEADPQSYFLVEFLGGHDFSWVKKCNTHQSFNASEDPNDNDSLRSRKVSRSDIKNATRTKTYRTAINEATKAIEECGLDHDGGRKDNDSTQLEDNSNTSDKTIAKRKNDELQHDIHCKRSKLGESVTSEANGTSDEVNLRINHDSDPIRVRKEDRGDVEVDLLNTPPASRKGFSIFLHTCFYNDSPKGVEKLVQWLDTNDETLYRYCETYLVAERVLDLMDADTKSIPFVWCCMQLLFKCTCGVFPKERANRMKLRIAKHEGICTLIRAIDNHQNERILAVLWGVIREILGCTEARLVVAQAEKVSCMESALRCLLLAKINGNNSIEIATKILDAVYFIVNGESQPMPSTTESSNTPFISTRFCNTLMDFALVHKDPWLKNEKIVGKLLKVLGACLLIPSIANALQASDYEDKLRPICVNCVRNVPSMNGNIHKEYVHLLNLLLKQDYLR